MCDKCKNCNVYLQDDKENCPLCGQFVHQSKEGQVANYPKYGQIQEKKRPLYKTIKWILLWLTLLTVVINLYDARMLNWSLYIVVSFILVYGCVFRPLELKNSFADVISRITFYLAGFLLFIELFSQSWGWGCIYVIPLSWMALTIICFVMTLCRGFVDFTFFKPIFMIIFLDIILLCLLLGFDQMGWAPLVALFAGCSIVALLFIFRFKRSIKSIKKEFNL